MKYITIPRDEREPISTCPDMAGDATHTASPSTPVGEDINTPLKAIRKKCLDCVGETALEVRLCPVTNCDLYPFRFGKDPFRKQTQLSEEEQARRREILKKNRGGKGRMNYYSNPRRCPVSPWVIPKGNSMNNPISRPPHTLAAFAWMSHSSPARPDCQGTQPALRQQVPPATLQDPLLGRMLP